MTLLQKQYDLETSRSQEDIFAEIRSKIEAQKNKNTFWGLELINYKNFKLNDNTIEIESWPITRVNPYEGVGTILFKFQQKEKGTSINCTIEVYNKYVSLLGSCFLTFFLIVFTVFIVLTLHDYWVKALMIILFVWALVISICCLTLLYHRNILEIYSKTVLNDLGIKNSSS
jgi:hypothetical protein